MLLCEAFYCVNVFLWTVFNLEKRSKARSAQLVRLRFLITWLRKLIPFATWILWHRFKPLRFGSFCFMTTWGNPPLDRLAWAARVQPLPVLVKWRPVALDLSRETFVLVRTLHAPGMICMPWNRRLEFHAEGSLLIDVPTFYFQFFVRRPVWKTDLQLWN